MINYNGDQHNRHFGHYLFDHAMAVIENLAASDDLDDEQLKRIRIGASEVLWPEKKKGKYNLISQSKHSIAIRELMIKRYENGEFPKVLQDIWDDVKSGNTDFG